jgi:DNA polymerase III alpha subunit
VYVQRRYTYTRGHAIAMAHVAWRVARIAAHYPAHLYAAVLDHLGSVGGGMYPNIVYVTEAQRHGLTVMGPNVNSAWHSVPQGTTIHAGLVTLRACISENTLRRVQQAGQDRPFHSIADLLERVVLTERDLEQLICAGALEPFTTSHRHARWEAHLARPTPQAQPPLLPEAALGVVPAIEAETAQERAHEEYATLGWTRSVAHPMAVYEAALAEQDVLPVATLGQHIGQTATVAGIIVATRHIHTQHGTPMLFVSLCDASGVAELVVFDNAVTHHHGRPITCGHVICAQGMVTHDQGRGVTLEVATVQVLR